MSQSSCKKHGELEFGRAGAVRCEHRPTEPRNDHEMIKRTSMTSIIGVTFGVTFGVTCSGERIAASPWKVPNDIVYRLGIADEQLTDR